MRPPEGLTRAIDVKKLLYSKCVELYIEILKKTKEKLKMRATTIHLNRHTATQSENHNFVVS